MKKLFYLIFAINITLTACGTAQTALPTHISTSTLIAIQNFTSPTSTIMPSEGKTTFAPPSVFFPVPTANSEQEFRIINLIQSQDCILPCYLGITPGKTTVQEARILLEDIKAGYIGDYQRRDGSTEYAFNLLKIGIPQNNLMATSEPEEVFLAQRISLISVDSIIQIIEAGVATKGMFPKYRDIWSRYSVAGIFSQLGVPDQIYLNQFDPLRAEYTYGQAVWAVYEEQGVVFHLYGTGKENNICPEKEATLVDLDLSLYNPDAGLDIYIDGRVQPTNRDVYLPIEEVLGITTTEFYNQVFSNPSVCFQTQ
jgi:hypothetical protein